MYKLYYYPLNASMAPHFILQYLAADYELIVIDRKTNAHKSPEYLLVNPTGRIPALAHNGLMILESSAISVYIAENFPESDLVPQRGDQNRSQFLQWQAYLASTLQNELMLFQYARQHCDSDSSSLEIKRIQEDKIIDSLKLVDQQLAERRYLLGDQLTVCDFYLVMLLIWASGVKTPPMRFSNLSRYLATMAEYEAIVHVCQKEGVSLPDYSVV